MSNLFQHFPEHRHLLDGCRRLPAQGVAAGDVLLRRADVNGLLLREGAVVSSGLGNGPPGRRGRRRRFYPRAATRWPAFSSPQHRTARTTPRLVDRALSLGRAGGELDEKVGVAVHQRRLGDRSGSGTQTHLNATAASSNCTRFLGGGLALVVVLWLGLLLPLCRLGVAVRPIGSGRRLLGHQRTPVELLHGGGGPWPA